MKGCVFLMPEWLSAFLSDTLLPGAIQIIFAILILLVGFKSINVLVQKIARTKLYERMEINIQSFMTNASRVVLKVILLIIVVEKLGVPSSSIIALLGTIGLAIGLALQGGLSNIASGVVIVVCRPFHVGDFIMADNLSGVVKEIGLYYTTLITPDNQSVAVPNSQLTGCSINNLSTESTRRIDFDFKIAYNTDIDLARKVLIATAANDDNVLKDPAPEVLVAGHGESFITIKLRLWVEAENYWTVYFAMYEDVKKAFDQFSISIPYPQLDVHLNP